MLEGSEIQLLKILCEQERTQILTIPTLSMENPHLASYMLTGNRSMFLSTDGSLAWLYHCPLMRSSPHVMNQCYDKIPILYKNAIFFVDPITRQTYPDAQVQNWSHRIKNLLQFDMEDEDSWFTITPKLDHRKRPAIFGPKDVTPVSRTTHEHSYPNSGTISLSALLQGKLCKSSHENSLSPTPHFMDQNSNLIMLHEHISMWTT